ncbi:MAG: N-acetyltransferase [Pirellulaceae bacterium]|nr:N-acetyltransferase [Pirellulaceae bacterium]
MSGVQFPIGWKIEILSKEHNRRGFTSGNDAVDQWLKESALQSQSKHLTSTKVLVGKSNKLIGYYSLATAQIDFSDLPTDAVKSLPRRQLPAAILAWFAIDQNHQGSGLEKRLFAAALRDCYQASQTFAFVAILLDCIDEPAKRFYKQFDFEELPGYPMRLFLSFKLLERMMRQ